jgi:outer membrane protein TolC
MLYRILSLTALCVLFAPAAPAQTPDTLTLGLEAVIQRALTVSPDIDERRAQVNFAQARRRFAKANRFATEFEATTAHAVAPGLDVPEDNFFPNDALYLNPDVDNDWEDLRPFNRVEAELTQALWTWGELGKSIEAARHGVDVERAAVDRQRLEVALRVGELYYNVLLTDALFRIARETGDIIDQAKREIDRLLKEGAEDVDDADLFQVQITEQEYNRRVVEVTQRRQTAYAALRRQLFLPPGQSVAPADDFLRPIDFTPDSLEAYFALALERRPEIQQARAGVAAREALVDVARSDYYPKLFLGVTARYAFAEGRYRQDSPYISDSFLSNSVRAGFGLRQQLNFIQTRMQVEQAQAERDEVQYQLEGARQLVLVEVEDAYRNLIIAEAALEAEDEALTISNEWLRVEQINFDLDLGDTENLVRAVRAQLEQEAAYYQAVQRYNVAVLRLLRATGVLASRAESGTLVDSSDE